MGTTSMKFMKIVWRPGSSTWAKTPSGWGPSLPAFVGFMIVQLLPGSWLCSFCRVHDCAAFAGFMIVQLLPGSWLCSFCRIHDCVAFLFNLNRLCNCHSAWKASLRHALLRFVCSRWMYVSSMLTVNPSELKTNQREQDLQRIKRAKRSLNWIYS